MFYTGCEVSCSYKYCKHSKPLLTDVKLNDSEIRVLGKTRLIFLIGGVPTTADLIVTSPLIDNI